MSKPSLERARTGVLKELLATHPFPGWTQEALERAAQNCGHDRLLVHALFPGGVADVLTIFSAMADREMLQRLKKTNPATMRVRDRVRTAVIARYEFLQPHKEAVRQAAAFWAMPLRKGRGLKNIWRTADCIWHWAGDTATDHNYYTKRALLAGVMTATTLCWMNDQNENMNQTKSFLDRRIENVMELGKVLGKIQKKT